MDEDLDYILSVISNKIRRDIIKIVAEEGPISYTKLMKRLGIKDSGTLGFHIKKMNKLFKKDDLGEYVLNELGFRAYRLINELEGRESSEEKEEEYEDIIISNKLNFNYTEELARKFLDEGKRAILTDIITLVIHKMPRELFDKTVKEISDCVSIKVPRDLYELATLKSDEVLNISVYDGDRGFKKGFSIPGFSLISDILSSVMNSITTLISSTKFTTATKKELFLENEISFPEKFDLEILLNSGVLELIPGDGYMRIWKTGLREPKVEYKISDDKVDFELERGYFEIYIPRRSVKGSEIRLEGGVLKIIDIEPDELGLNLSGGYAEIKMSTTKPIKIKQKLNGGVLKYNLVLEYEKGETELISSLNGGVCEGVIKIPNDMKLNIHRETYGGYTHIEVDNLKITDKEYAEIGFEDADKRLKTTIKTYGGLSKLRIIKSEL